MWPRLLARTLIAVGRASHCHHGAEWLGALSLKMKTLSGPMFLKLDTFFRITREVFWKCRVLGLLFGVQENGQQESVFLIVSLQPGLWTISTRYLWDTQLLALASSDTYSEEGFNISFSHQNICNLLLVDTVLNTIGIGNIPGVLGKQAAAPSPLLFPPSQDHKSWLGLAAT